MTVIVTRPSSRRDDRVATHTYTVPVVRELPAPTVKGISDSSW
jgi:hypothetical protein